MLVLAVLMLLYLIFMDKFMAFTMKQTIKNMKKQGKLPYTPSAVMEFNEEAIIETTPDQKTEFRYSSLERISVVDNKVIYLHQDNVRGYILPFSSFQSQEEKDAFLEFIKTKCPVVDTY